MKLTDQQKERIQALGLSPEESREILKYLSNQRKTSLFFDNEDNLLKTKEQLSAAATLYNEKRRKQEEEETRLKEKQRIAKKDRQIKEEFDTILREEPKGDFNQHLKESLSRLNDEEFTLTEEETEQAERFCKYILIMLKYKNDIKIRKEIKELQDKINEDTKKVEELKKQLQEMEEHQK